MSTGLEQLGREAAVLQDAALRGEVRRAAVRKRLIARGKQSGSEARPGDPPPANKAIENGEATEGTQLDENR